MIICICANVSEDDIKEALQEGKTPEDIGCCQNCCICKETITQIVDEQPKRT